MQIIPIRDLKNTVEVENRCANGPVYVKKNGQDRLVVMNIDYYNRTQKEMQEARQILEGLKDIKIGNTLDGDTGGICGCGPR